MKSSQPIWKILFAAIILNGCVASKSPKHLTVLFVTHISQLDFDKAENLVTDSSRKVIELFRNNYIQTPESESDLKNLEYIDASTIVTILKLDSLQEYLQERYGKVYNSDFEINLEKNKSEWQIVANKDVITNILNIASRKKEIYDALTFVKIQYQKKNQFIREMLDLIKMNKPSAFNFSELDSLLIKGPLLDRGFSIEQLDSYLSYQNKINDLYIKLLLHIDNTGYSKDENIDKCRLNIEVQDKRIIVAVHDYNKLIETINSNYIIKSPSSRDPNVEF